MQIKANKEIHRIDLKKLMISEPPTSKLPKVVYLSIFLEILAGIEMLVYLIINV